MRRAFAWRKIGRIVVLLIGIGAICGFFSWGINRIFTITNIEVGGEGIQIEVDAANMPKNLLFFPVEQVTQQLLRDYTLVGSVIIQKKYPNTLRITAVPRKPFAIVGIDRETYLVDDQGIVLKQYPLETGLPFIRIAAGGVEPGVKISDQAILASVNFIREIQTIVSIREVTMNDTTSLRAQSATMSIVFAQHADIPALIRTLQTVIEGFRIKGTLPTTVDLRFDKPVVTF
ncbi:MAG: FtsQ-type POTRA domain-containing protein [Candidatus Gottesmanbacteria bacterium]|nr:FtsQ-type POTRA domain-containing protein [Candidatus Gottesmanbacteria bacterium]